MKIAHGQHTRGLEYGKVKGVLDETDTFVCVCVRALMIPSFLLVICIFFQLFLFLVNLIQIEDI